MSKKTRYFVMVAAGILAVGLGTGLVASYMGLPVSLVSQAAGPSELQYVPADAAVVAMAFAARFSGDELQERLGGQVAAEHGEMGEVLPFFALGLLFAAVLVQALRSSDVSVPDRLPAALTLVVAAVALYWTVRTGHSGSEAVWSSIVQQTGG